jgi:hypothetical protein
MATGACGGSSPTTPTPTTTTVPPPRVTFVADANPGTDVIALGLTTSTVTEFTLVLTATEVVDLYGYGVDLSFDPTLVEFDSAEAGAFLDGEDVTVTTQVVEGPVGTLVIGQSRVGAEPGVSGNGTLLTLNFKSVAAGSTTFTVANSGAFDSTGAPLETQFLGGTATVPAQPTR